MEILKINVILIAGISFFSFIFYLYYYLKNKENILHLYFSLFCIFLTGYLFSAYGVYSSSSFQNSIIFQKIQLLHAPIIAISLLLFFLKLINIKLKKFLYTISSIFIIIIIYNLFSNHTIINTPSIKHICYLNITYNEAQLGIGASLLFLTIFIAIGVFLYYFFREFKKNKKILKPFFISFIIFALSIINDMLISLKIYSFIYTIEYGFLALIVSMSFSLIKKNILLNKEIINLNNNLKKKVKEKISEIEKINRKLEKLSLTDDLTGLFNKRYLNLHLEQEWNRLKREKKYMTILMIDIDFFKQYNDTYGHIRGDICLKKIAKVIKSNIKRSGDFSSRYGGEEFVIVLSNTKINGGKIIAKNILSDITKLNIQHKSSTIKNIVSISIGIASKIPTAKNSPKDLLNISDENLYKSKNTGRDKISF